MEHNLEQQHRYERWAELIASNPVLIDRLPCHKKAYLVARVRELKQKQLEEARHLYLKQRSISIAPESSSHKLSEHFVTILIIAISSVLFGTGTANLVKESGREDLGILAGVLGGATVGCLAEYAGKKLFIHQAMSKQYHSERERLLQEREVIVARHNMNNPDDDINLTTFPKDNN